MSRTASAGTNHWATGDWGLAPSVLSDLHKCGPNTGVLATERTPSA
jgi:hypothetical protein